MHPTPAHPFFLRRKDAKTYQRGGILFEITSGGSLPHSGLKTTLPLVYHKTSSKKGGSVTACGYCGGTAPRGYLRGSPLDTLLLTFLVKEKSVPVWAAQAHKAESLIKFEGGKETKTLYTLP